MAVESDNYRINAYKWRDELLALYGAAPGSASAAAIVVVLRGQLRDARELYAQYVTIVIEGVAVAQQIDMVRQFRGWHLQAEALERRLDGYLEDATDAPEGEPQPEYSDAWVAKPLFEGEWPDDYYLFLQATTPDVPDVVHLASLWNQVVALKEVAEGIGDPLDRLVINWLEEGERQLSASAPGEDPTVADAWNAAKDGAGELAAGSLKWLGVLLGVGLGGVLLYKFATRR